MKHGDSALWAVKPYDVPYFNAVLLIVSGAPRYVYSPDIVTALSIGFDGRMRLVPVQPARLSEEFEWYKMYCDGASDR